MSAFNDDEREYKFFLSCDLTVPVRFKVESLIGSARKKNDGSEARNSNYYDLRGNGSSSWDCPPQLYVECVLTIDGEATGIPETTRTCLAGDNTRWDEWISFPFKFSDLTINSQLAITVWDDSDPFEEVSVGGCTVSLFTKRREFRRGRHKQKLWDGQCADGGFPSTTPGKIPKSERGKPELFEKLRNKFDWGEIPRHEWLDSLAFRAMKDSTEAEAGSSGLFLWIELPNAGLPVVFQEIGFHAMSQKCHISAPELVMVQDPEVDHFLNPAEQMESKLAKDSARLGGDRELKPNSAERRELSSILSKPSTIPLAPSERSLLWKFRYSLMMDKRALTKLLKCVDWTDPQESAHAVELMKKWVGIDMADAIELLSPEFSSEDVRAFAVSVLSVADDEELLCYLLQLVQALRFERSDASPLASFLIQRCSKCYELSTFLHWYLLVEWQEHSHGHRYSSVHQQMVQALEQERAGTEVYDSLRRQSLLTAKLEAMVLELKTVRGGSGKKIERLRQILALSDGVCAVMSEHNPLPFPLNPSVSIAGVVPEDSHVFKSVLNPVKVCFRTGEGRHLDVIFKKGDDLRQDQLIIQMVHLMDRLLKKENLDLKLTPYRVLATGIDNGFVEFVPSMALATVLEKHKSIVRYLRGFHPDEQGPYGISQECLDTFVKSCAGYCVMMYILGVGDRHLDNLMLCQDGRLFHIDFGFILGRDPKPFPPPMKLCKEMVEAMGGSDSPHYVRFKSYACEAYNILRKSSNLILSLFHLMGDANIPDIASDPQKGMVKLQQKFRLDLDDEAAVQFFQSLINESVSALFPQVVETIHRWAQYWR